jgi:hypothetical protein
MIQTILTAIVLLLALSFAVWRIFRAFRGDSDPCSCCELKKNCKKFGQSKEK